MDQLMNSRRAANTYHTMAGNEGRAEKTVGQRSEFRQKLRQTEESSIDGIKGRSKGTVPKMTLEEYKDYIRDQITNLWLNPVQGNVYYAIHITDAAFARMQKDKEYEEYVIDSIRTNMGFSPPFWKRGTCYVILYFTGEKKDDWSCSYSSQLEKDGYDRKAEGSTWNKSAEEKARAKKKLKKHLEKKYFEKKYLERERVEELLLERSLESLERIQELSMQSLSQLGIRHVADPSAYKSIKSK